MSGLKYTLWLVGGALCASLVADPVDYYERVKNAPKWSMGNSIPPPLFVRGERVAAQFTVHRCGDAYTLLVGNPLESNRFNLTVEDPNAAQKLDASLNHTFAGVVVVRGKGVGTHNTKPGAYEFPAQLVSNGPILSAENPGPKKLRRIPVGQPFVVRGRVVSKEKESMVIDTVDGRRYAIKMTVHGPAIRADLSGKLETFRSAAIKAGDEIQVDIYKTNEGDLFVHPATHAYLTEPSAERLAQYHAVRSRVQDLVTRMHFALGADNYAGFRKLTSQFYAEKKTLAEQEAFDQLVWRIPAEERPVHLEELQGEVHEIGAIYSVDLNAMTRSQLLQFVTDWADRKVPTKPLPHGYHSKDIFEILGQASFPPEVIHNLAARALRDRIALYEKHGWSGRWPNSREEVEASVDFLDALEGLSRQASAESFRTLVETGTLLLQKAEAGANLDYQIIEISAMIGGAMQNITIPRDLKTAIQRILREGVEIQKRWDEQGI